MRSAIAHISASCRFLFRYNETCVDIVEILDHHHSVALSAPGPGSMQKPNKRAEQLRMWLRMVLGDENLTQAELARRLSVELGRQIDRAAVNKMVCGNRAIAADELYAIAQICHVALPILPVPAIAASYPEQAA